MFNKSLAMHVVIVSLCFLKGNASSFKMSTYPHLNILITYKSSTTINITNDNIKKKVITDFLWRF